MLKSFLTILLLPIFFLGCTPKQDIQSITLNQEFITRVGQYHMTPDKDFIFGLSKIIDDSRGICPRNKNVVCAWDGAIIVQLRVTNLSGDGEAKYQEGMAHQRQHFGNYVLEIHKVRPRKPRKNHEKYRFTIELRHLIPATINPAQQEKLNIENTIPPQARVSAETLPPSERYKDLDTKEISRAEIDELIALEKQQRESNQVLQEELQTWNTQDPSVRGPQPQWKVTPQLERIRELNGKVQIAKIRKAHKNIDTKILLKADAEEYISLQQAQTRLALEHQKKMTAWSNMDPTTRGPQPEMGLTQMEGNNPRLQELLTKVRTAHGVQRETDRIKQLSETYNITILDNEMSELIELYAEEQKLQGEIQLAIMKSLTSGEISALDIGGGELSGELIEKLPQDILLRMSEVGQRLEAIEAPFQAAEKADKTREDMAKLSETSGVPISVGDIEETVALNAEKDIILKRTQVEAVRKWKAKGSPLSAVQKPLPNAEDDARLKEIEARLKTIYAPMIEAK